MRTDPGVEGLSVLRGKVEQSRSEWQKLDAQHGGSYSYVRRETFNGNGFCVMTVQAQNDHIVSRTQTVALDLPPATWTEMGARVGAHGDACYPVQTVDDLYTECLGKILCMSPLENYISVTFDSQDILTGCWYRPTGCVDDCTVGINQLAVTFDSDGGGGGG
jgi:hypothetical protein